MRFMLRFVILGALMFGVVGVSKAQEPGGTFDPLVYMLTFKMGDQYTDGKFLTPPDVQTTFENYLIDKADILAFSIKHKSKDSLGWTMWMDFAIDRFGSKRLNRIFAQKAVPKNPHSEFAKFKMWVEEVFDSGGIALLSSEKGKYVYSYQDPERYTMVIKLTEKQENNNRYITIDVEEK